MDEDRAILLAKCLDGNTWNSGGGIWLVLRKRADGKLAVFSDEAVAIYADEETISNGVPEESIIIV